MSDMHDMNKLNAAGDLNDLNDLNDLSGPEEAASCPACSEKSKHRDGKEYKDLITRLNKIEGQIRGIKKMVEDDRYCIDIINQVSAVSAAINSFNKVLLSEHIKSCVVEDVKSGNSQMIDELCATLHKLMR